LQQEKLNRKIKKKRKTMRSLNNLIKRKKDLYKRKIKMVTKPKKRGLLIKKKTRSLPTKMRKRRTPKMMKNLRLQNKQRLV